jgi:hypothetical protein
MRRFRRADEIDNLLAQARIEPEELASFGRELRRCPARPLLSNVDPDKIQLPEGAPGKSSVCTSQQHSDSAEGCRVKNFFAGGRIRVPS